MHLKYGMKQKKMPPQNPEVTIDQNPMSNDWHSYFEEEELEKVYKYYKDQDSKIIPEEEIESDKSDDSCMSSDCDGSSDDDLSMNELKENIYFLPRKQTDRPHHTKKKPTHEKKKSKSGMKK